MPHSIHPATRRVLIAQWEKEEEQQRRQQQTQEQQEQVQELEEGGADGGDGPAAARPARRQRPAVSGAAVEAQLKQPPLGMLCIPGIGSCAERQAFNAHACTCLCVCVCACVVCV